MSPIAISIEVSGRVQDVYFRASTKEVCDQLGVVGWVKNLPTGHVLIHAQGYTDQLDQLKHWCHSGPPLANVSEIVVKDIELKSYADFEVRY